MTFPEEILTWWNMSFECGFKTHHLGLSGLDEWNKLKSIIPRETFVGEWTDSVKMYYGSLKNLYVKGDTIVNEHGVEIRDDDTNIWEPHHFLLQHGRIIYNNPNASMIRLMQIAFNNGQLEAIRGKWPIYFSDKQIKFYDSVIGKHPSDYILI